jgi:putative aldouronate transport system permease protein
MLRKMPGISHKIKISPRRWISLKYFLIAIPFLIQIIAFSYVPIFGWAYAFFDYKLGLKFSELDFVGLKNFLNLFKESREIIRVLRNTLVMSMLAILVSPLPAVFGIMLNEISNSKLKRIVQTITTFPHFISWIVVFGLSWAMFSASAGMIPNLLQALGFKTSRIGILGNNDLVWPFQISLQVWKGLGWSAIIYLAAISGIDEELYCAAKVDGANKIQMIWNITVPGIMPTYLVLLLLGISNLLNTGFDQFFMFYNGFVADKIEVLDYYVYKLGIIFNQYSYSIALGMLKSIVSIILLFSANRFSKIVRGDPLI